MRPWSFVGAALVLAACTGNRAGLAAGPGTAEPAVCVDHDHDGFGDHCAAGHDCDDGDRTMHEGCQQCANPEEGCTCELGSRPTSCFLDKTIEDDGTVMCHEGTRYCRNGSWSGCESVFSYPRAESMNEQGVVSGSDGGLERCSDCAVNCFVLRDNLDPIDGGITAENSEGIAFADGGGLSLQSIVFDAGVTVQDAGTSDTSGCVPGFAPDHDCDGLQDQIDPYPFMKPFETANGAIFFDIGPGQTETGVIDLRFYTHTADVYFLIDQTDTMQSVRNKLKNALTTGSYLGADVVCADTDANGKPNNELKAKGIIGAIRCLMRDAHFGVGYMREIPFDPYGDGDEVTFKHLMDIGTSETAAIAAVNSMAIDADKDWPDAQPLALYSVATGNGLYMGLNKPGVLPRVGCPAAKWGYPCFRDDAIPVVVMITDSAEHNGAALTGHDYRYDPSKLGITAGTTSAYVTLPVTNETFVTQYDMGDLTNQRVTYAGNTSSMSADLGQAIMTCLAAAEDQAPDATFTFNLTQTKTVNFSTAGSTFNGALGLFTHITSSATARTSNNANEDSVTAFDFGDVRNSWNSITGNTSSMVASYPGSAVGCGAANTSPDAAYVFTLSQDAHVALDASGSSFGTVLGLYENVIPAAPTSKAVSNLNDSFPTAYDLGDVYQKYVVTTGATTDVGTINADYTSTQIGCGSNGASPDAAFKLSISQPTRLRFDTAGSAFDTVLSVSNGDPGTRLNVNVSNTNDTQSTAKVVGDLLGKWYRFSGSTVPLAANFRDTFIGCNATTSSPDAVYTFTLSSPTRVRLNTSGSSFDTVISLHDGDIDPVLSTTLTANTNEVASSATGVYDLGVMNDAWKEYSGGSTAAMIAEYDDSVIGCGAATAAKDAVYKFSLTSPTTVHLDTIGSSFDTVVSLHDAVMPRDTTTAIATPQETYSVGMVNGKSQVFTGSTATMTSDWGGEAMGCSAADAARDALFQITLGTATSLEVSTEGSSFDTSLGLFPATVTDPKRPAATPITNDNETFTSNPRDVGVLDGAWVVISGDTKSMDTDYGVFGCGETGTAPDAIFKFTLNSPRTVTVDLGFTNPAFDTVIALYDSAFNFLTCDNDGAGNLQAKITRSLAAGTYWVMLKGRLGGDKGPYTMSFRDSTVSNVTSCDNDGVAPAGASKLTASLAAGTYNVLLKGTSSTASGNYKIRFRDLGYIAANHRVTCDDNGGGGTASQIEQALGVGTYYAVIKSKSSTDNGSYKLRVRDLNSTQASNHELACNDDDSAVTSSKIERDLAAGTYHVVVKGKSTTGGSYNLEMQDLTPVNMGAMLGCNDNDTAVSTSMLEQDFSTSGTYYVFVKGKNTSDKGNYTLRVRDVTNTAVTPTLCSSSGGTSGAALIDQDLTAGTYYALLKGKTAGGGGAYTLSVRDVATATQQQLACNTSGTFSQSLPKGAYDLVLKGNQNNQKGPFSLTAGAAATQSGTFVPPTWDETLAALQAKDVHVMSVLNCHDEGGHGDGRSCDQSVSQARTLANATDTLGLDLQPLVVNLDDANGTGVEQAVVDQIRALAGYLSMNVSVRMVFEPDANPGFGVSVTAVDVAGDGCDGLVGVEHQNCAPGATPTFHISFTNPLGSPVPKNPLDPNGGYNFRAELIANGKYFVDAVPIYVIPEDLSGATLMPPPALPSSGSYWQDLPSRGCSGNLLPDWHDLSWNADVPSGTAVRFDVCTAATLDELDSCTYTPICSLNGNQACTSDADCPDSYCASNGVCQTITSGVCTSDTDCPSPATCISNACTFPGQPVYVGQALGNAGANMLPFLRMKITLLANTNSNETPTVYDWALTYYCVNSL